MMDIQAFRALLERYGADRRRWPAGLRAAAEARLDHDAEARILLDEEADFEAVLDTWAAPAPGQALRDAVLAAAPAPRSGPGLSLPRGWYGAGIGALMAASCAAGILVGLMLVAPAEPADAGGDAAIWAALSGSSVPAFDEASESEQS